MALPRIDVSDVAGMVAGHMSRRAAWPDRAVGAAHIAINVAAAVVGEKETVLTGRSVRSL